MKGLTGEVESLMAHVHGQFAGRCRDTTQIDRVAQQGVAIMGQVDTDLMRPSRGQPALHERYPRMKSFFRREACQGVFAAIRDDGHALAVPLIPSDRPFKLA